MSPNNKDTQNTKAVCKSTF